MDPYEADSQMVILDRFCREVHESVIHAPDLEGALKRKADICTRFEGECSSKLVADAVRRYVDHLVEERWKPTRGEEGI